MAVPSTIQSSSYTYLLRSMHTSLITVQLALYWDSGHNDQFPHLHPSPFPRKWTDLWAKSRGPQAFAWLCFYMSTKYLTKQPPKCRPRIFSFVAKRDYISSHDVAHHSKALRAAYLSFFSWSPGYMLIPLFHNYADMVIFYLDRPSYTHSLQKTIRNDTGNPDLISKRRRNTTMLTYALWNGTTSNN